MTHTLHRRGAIERLRGEYVIFATTASGITREGSGPKIREFARICLKYHPVNMGNAQDGNMHMANIDIQKLMSEQQDGAGVWAVFVDLETLRRVVEELIRADLGISINISGLLDGVDECCRQTGIKRHSVEQSLGIWGATDRLPERETLEVHTMCGHGMVSFGLIRKMMDYVKLRRLTPKEAARIMAKGCRCGVFNPDRAEVLLEKVRQGGR
jgi:hypothetical protein